MELQQRGSSAAARPHEEPAGRWRAMEGRASWLLSGFVAVVAVVVYARTIHAGLYLDDRHHVRPWTAREVIGTFHGRFDPLGIEPVYFRPLVVVTFALDWAAWGWHAAGAHVTNVLLHAVACTLLVLLLLRLGATRLAAAGGAVLFALIPANAAAAVYISERSDTMVAIASLVGALAVLRYERDRGTRWIVALVSSYLFAIGSKEVGVAMLGSTALVWWYLQVPAAPIPPARPLDWWCAELRRWAHPFIGRRAWVEWARLLGPMVIIALGTFAFRAAVLPTGALSERYSAENPAKALVSAVGHSFAMVPWELAASAAPLLAAPWWCSLPSSPRPRRHGAWWRSAPPGW